MLHPLTQPPYAFKYRDKDPRAGLLPDEPYFFLRARDRLSIDAVEAYKDALKQRSDELFAAQKYDEAAEVFKQARGIQVVLSKWLDWQDDNKQHMKFPD